MTSRLTAFIGPDRVGKSTLAKKHYDYSSRMETAKLFHGKEPIPSHENLYDQYLEPLTWFMGGGHRKLILDRCWICSLTYELSRKNSPVSSRDVFSLELSILRMLQEDKSLDRTVSYTLVKAPWSVVAGRHSEEILSLNGDINGRLYEEAMLARRNEHQLYYETVTDYLDNWSVFPYSTVELG